MRLGRCWPARPTIAQASTQLCGKRLSPTARRQTGECRRRYFSHYVPILDFVHAADVRLCRRDDGPQARTKVGRLIAIGRNGSGRARSAACSTHWRSAAAGARRPRTERNRHPLAPQVANSLAYLTNQRERMKYDQYRKQGLPITSSPIRSTVKQTQPAHQGHGKVLGRRRRPHAAISRRPTEPNQRRHQVLVPPPRPAD